MLTFESLDGLKVEFLPSSDGDVYKVFSLMYRIQNGYGNIVPLRGAPGLTELCIHNKTANLNGIVAFCNAKKSYAYVLFEDGRIVDGSFHQFEDGTWNIS